MITWYFIWSLVVSPWVPGVAQPVTAFPVTFDRFQTQQQCDAFRTMLASHAQVIPYSYTMTICQSKP